MTDYCPDCGGQYGARIVPHVGWEKCKKCGTFNPSSAIYAGTSTWTVDGNGYLLTPSGTKAARVVDGALLLYDKRTKTEVPLTAADYWTVTHTEQAQEAA